jgi:hypothetical protein
LGNMLLAIFGYDIGYKYPLIYILHIMLRDFLTQKSRTKKP